MKNSAREIRMRGGPSVSVVKDPRGVPKASTVREPDDGVTVGDAVQGLLRDG